MDTYCQSFISPSGLWLFSARLLRKRTQERDRKGRNWINWQPFLSAKHQANKTAVELDRPKESKTDSSHLSTLVRKKWAFLNCQIHQNQIEKRRTILLSLFSL